PFCIAAKRLLDQKGVAYEETDVGANPALRQEMMQRANGRYTVPQIFIGGQGIGGCDDLHALDHQGKLDALLAG
ncbi:MAG: glutaredoxin 3, partial [Paracoccaceae bacterium]